MVLGKRLNHTHRNSHNEPLKKKRKTVKKSKLHPNAKAHNGKNVIPRKKIHYPSTHIFPYITDSNLVKHNLWSTRKNMNNAITDATRSLSDVKRINEKLYLLTHKRLPNEPIKLFKNLATLTPAEFAHVKATCIKQNVLRHK